MLWWPDWSDCQGFEKLVRQLQSLPATSDQCDAVCQTLGLSSIYPGFFHGDVIEDLVTLHCMPLSLQISSARCWIECGLEVDTSVCHSFGQLAALCVAGSISVEDLFRLVSGRAKLFRDK
jgi:acyl transferase domain-containing protein